jgi:hypothetical protein
LADHSKVSALYVKAFMEAEFNINVLGWVPTPGPPDYPKRLQLGDEARKWTIGDRFERPVDHDDPSLLSLKTTVGQAPRYSLSSRHPHLKKFIPPGPNFQPPPFYKAAPQINFPHGVKAPIPITPGPADYHLTPGCIKATGTNSPRPAVREGGPRQLWDPVEPTPGPAAYRARHPKAENSTPKWTIKIQMKERAHEQTGEYIGERTTLGGPKWGFSTAFRPRIMHR